MEENKEQPEVKNPALKLAKKLQEDRNSLHIGRIPKKTKEQFIAFADEEFCGDFGMALKWLMDDIPGNDLRLVVAKLEELEARISELETPRANEIPKEKKGRTIKLCDGNKMEAPEN